jgi:hypothetical protein
MYTVRRRIMPEGLYLRDIALSDLFICHFDDVPAATESVANVPRYCAVAPGGMSRSGRSMLVHL